MDPLRHDKITPAPKKLRERRRILSHLLTDKSLRSLASPQTTLEFGLARNVRDYGEQCSRLLGMHAQAGPE
jgi:hypothetical protein